MKYKGNSFPWRCKRSTLLKETQVQNSNKSESVEIKAKQEKRSLYKKKDKKKPKNGSHNTEDDEMHHIDLTI